MNPPLFRPAILSREAVPGLEQVAGVCSFFSVRCDSTRSTAHNSMGELGFGIFASGFGRVSKWHSMSLILNNLRLPAVGSQPSRRLARERRISDRQLILL